MKLSFKNFFVGVSILALTFAAINVTPVFAADLDDIYEKEIVDDIIRTRIPEKWESKDIFPNLK